MKKGRYEEAWDRLYECFDEETEEGSAFQALMRQIYNAVYMEEVSR
jgi:hypothetical protein